MVLICNFQQLHNLVRLWLFECPAAVVWAVCAGGQPWLGVGVWEVRLSCENPVSKLTLFVWGLCWSSGPCCLPSPPDLISNLPYVWLTLGCCHQPGLLVQVLCVLVVGLLPCWPCQLPCSGVAADPWYSPKVAFSLLGSSVHELLMQNSWSYSQGLWTSVSRGFCRVSVYNILI